MTDREQLGRPGEPEPPQQAGSNGMTLGEARKRSRARARQTVRTAGSAPLVLIHCGRCARIRREVSRADEPAPANDGSVMVYVPRCPCDVRTPEPGRSPLVSIRWAELLPLLEKAERLGRPSRVSFYVRDTDVD